MTPYGLAEIYRRFEGEHCFHIQGRGVYSCVEERQAFTRLYDVISQKKGIFIVLAVRYLNLAHFTVLCSKTVLVLAAAARSRKGADGSGHRGTNNAHDNGWHAPARTSRADG